MRLKMKTNKIIVFDTTLRDGEQAPGHHMNHKEKMKIAKELVNLGVDVIEAGFARSSPEERESIHKIANEFGKYSTICSLARANYEDIETAAKQLEKAEKARIHTFLATSDLHLKYKLNMSREQALEQITQKVGKAKSYIDDIQFSLEDFGRTDKNYAVRAIITAIKSGATTINLPDTVGYLLPIEMGIKTKYVIGKTRKELGNLVDKITFACHCHNDLGNAVAHTCEAIRNGVRQIEVTINGIGERTGNTSFESVLANIITRGQFELNPYTGEKDPFYEIDISHIDNKRISRISNIVSKCCKNKPPKNAPIVGENAFKHESGIHTDGMNKNRETYEIIRPEDYGRKSEIVFGRRSGSKGLKVKYESMNIHIKPDELNKISERFYANTDNIDEADDVDFILALTGDKQIPEFYHLTDPPNIIRYKDGDVRSLIRMTVGDNTKEFLGKGDGPVDASINAIRDALNLGYKLKSYNQDAQEPEEEGSRSSALTTIRLSKNGWNVKGTAIHTDIVESGINSFIQGCNRLKYLETFYSKQH
jgi:2-isopropylmalate synthase